MPELITYPSASEWASDENGTSALVCHVCSRKRRIDLPWHFRLRSGYGVCADCGKDIATVENHLRGTTRFEPTPTDIQAESQMMKQAEGPEHFHHREP